MKIYYVYKYDEADTGVPRYIGKGKGSRAFSHHNLARALLDGSDRAHLPVHERMAEQMAQGRGFTCTIIASALTETEAHAIEAQKIARYGREITGDGPLWNILPGGDLNMPPEYRFEAARKAHATMLREGTYPYDRGSPKQLLAGKRASETRKAMRQQATAT